MKETDVHDVSLVVRAHSDFVIFFALDLSKIEKNWLPASQLVEKTTFFLQAFFVFCCFFSCSA
ncbi:hypothetical protein MOC96_18890, partial [Bacillus vallismortis]